MRVVSVWNCARRSGGGLARECCWTACWAVAGVLILGGGCRTSPPPSPPPGARVQATDRQVVVPLETGDRQVLAEIHQAGLHSLESDRIRAFKRIAGRKNLPQAAQAALVSGAFRDLQFDDHRLEVLERLIRNRSFGDAGREAIRLHLDQFRKPEHRVRVLHLLKDKE